MKKFNNDYVTCDILGPGDSNNGLGNQLFCIATTLAYSYDFKKQAVFPQITTSNGIKEYSNIFYKKLSSDSLQLIHSFYVEPSFSFSKIPFFSGNVFLKGYFQSEKYFSHHREKIIEKFNIKECIENIYDKYGNYSDYTSIHVRRKDFLKFSDYHNVLPIQYYKAVISKFDKKEKYLIFSDDIEWCKNNFTFLNNIEFSPCSTDYEDLLLMSTCKNNIIANSTFSWWGAWFNQNKQKVVFYPKKWFGYKNSHLVTDNLCPIEWRKI
jgi:hypothetical protein